MQLTLNTFLKCMHGKALNTRFANEMSLLNLVFNDFNFSRTQSQKILVKTRYSEDLNLDNIAKVFCLFVCVYF